MRSRVSSLAAAVAVSAAIYLTGHQWVLAQQSGANSANAVTRVAAIPSEKGGQDIFGAYEVVAGWPKKLSTIPGHGPWTFGAGQSVFAESPDRIYVVQRGELPDIPLRVAVHPLDGKIYDIFEGTAEIQRLVIARAISGMKIK